MTTVPGTYFTEKQLESALKVDNVSGGILTGSWRMNNIGYKYKNEKKQYDKALAWYILAARKNDSTAQNNIGVLYYDGNGVPKNYLCALKWYLKSAQQNNIGDTAYSIGILFENGYGVPIDKHKALEWYCRDKDKTNINRLNGQGYHRYEKDKKKTLQQLRNETEAILEAEKKKLEEKQYKTLEEMEVLEQLHITYKLVDGGKDAWKDVPILLAASKQHSLKSINSSAINYEDEIIDLKKQIQLLKQGNYTFERQAKQLESLKQEVPNIELQTKEKGKEFAPLRNDNQSLQWEKSTVQQQIKANDSKITSLQSENQELKLKINNLEQQVKEKDNRNISFQTENQSLKYRIDEYEQQIKSKDDKISMLESEKHTSHSTPMQQTQTLKALEQEKQMMEQDKANTINEMERLKASYATLEQLLKAKEDTIASLNRENLMLSTISQGNQQGANEMVETLKNLLQAKTSETELLKHNMEHLLANEQRKIGALEEENMVLKQERTRQERTRQERTRQERTRQQVTVQSTSPSNISPTNSDPSHNNQHDDSYNDLNYESEYSDTEESEANDINYDTPSEDEDTNNGHNYNNTK